MKNKSNSKIVIFALDILSVIAGVFYVIFGWEMDEQIRGQQRIKDEGRR